MALSQMRQVVTSDPAITQLQGALNDQFSQLTLVPFINGVKVSATLASGLNQVLHKLGRTPQGYFVISNSANVTLWNDSFTESAIPLRSSGATSVTLWVF